ncbi:MAG: type II secretion system protein M [Desulfobacterales bacterium]|nr:type II secretion system protein M [Desulfobacterales bacterium]
MRKLNRREKTTIGIAGLVLLCLAVTEWVVLPMEAQQTRIQQTLEARTKELAEMMKLQAAYESVRAAADWQTQRLSGRQQGFTLFSHMDGLAGKAGVKAQIAYMKPSVTVTDKGQRVDRVEIKLQGIPLSPLVSFIHGIEASDDLIWIRRLSVSKSGKVDAGVIAVLQVETWAS